MVSGGSEVLMWSVLRITALPGSPPLNCKHWAVLRDVNERYLVVLNSKKNFCFISMLAERPVFSYGKAQ